MADKVILRNDYERMVPEFHKGTLTYAEHITRYKSAQALVEDKVVLDIASGSGYGTKMLAERAKKVYGVDNFNLAVEYSNDHYGENNIQYLLGDAEHIPLEDDSVDVVVSFETIEHVKDYKKFIKEIKRVLKPNGLSLISTPNDLEFAEGNHFHLHEFKYDELMKLLKGDFRYTKSYYQATSKYVAVGNSSFFSKEGPVKAKLLNLAPTSPKKYLYFYIICSNEKITQEIEAIAAIGEHYSDREMTEKASQVMDDKARIKSLESLLDSRNKELRLIKDSKSYKIMRRISFMADKLMMKQ